MPFQVSLNVLNQVLGVVTITLFNVEIIDPYATTIELVASVVAGRLEGHTINWVLAAGDPVQFITPTDQLTTTVDLMGVHTDRIFQFQVDLGRRSQHIYLVKYWGTITELLPFTEVNNITPIQYSASVPNVDCSSIKGVQSTLDTDIYGIGVDNPSAPMLIWQLPQDTTNLQLVTVEALLNGVWTSVLTLTPTDPQLLGNPIVGSWYRIKTTYKIDNQYHELISCNYYFTIDESAHNTYIDEIYSNIEYNIIYENPVYFSISNTNSLTNEIVSEWVGNQANIINNVSTVYFSLLNADSITNEMVSECVISEGNSINPITVVYLSGIIIGV
jgi:hypothetical protein